MYLDLISSKLLRPKGYEFELIVYHDGTFRFDGSVTYGKSEQNAIAGHQVDSNKFKTSGISTTPHISRAKYYALNQGYSGYILYFEKKKLIEDGVQFFVVSEKIPNPKVVEDDEVIIKMKDDSSLPIILIHKIKPISLSSF